MRIMGIKSSTPNIRFQRFQSICLITVKGKPLVKGPEYTAGASATKSESDSPNAGTMPRASCEGGNKLNQATHLP